MKKRLLIIAVAAALQSCASNKLAEPLGSMEAANDKAKSEMLVNGAGYVIASESADIEVYKNYVFGGKQPFKIPENPEDYTHVPSKMNADGEYDTAGAQIVSRRLSVGFEFGSSTFSPKPSQKYHMMQLLPVAKRWVISATTFCRVCKDVDWQMARIRAESTKEYLTDRGVNPDDITLSYQAGGWRGKESHLEENKDMIRRVDIEAIVSTIRSAKL